MHVCTHVIGPPPLLSYSFSFFIDTLCCLMICEGVGISGFATAPTDFTGILSETEIPKILLPFIDLFSIFF